MTCGTCKADSDYGTGSGARFGVSTALITYVVFLIAGLIIYHDGFDTPFYYDSAAKLEARRHFFDQGLRSALHVFPQRPLATLSFYVNYLAVGTQSGYYRGVNTAILAAVAVVAAVLLFRILTIPGVWNRGSPTEKKVLSVTLGLVYLVHPLQVFVTLYVWQRMTLMACLFSLASLSAYVSARSGRLEHRNLRYGLSLLFFACALFSKEIGVTIPVILIIFESAFFRDPWRNRCIRAAVFAAITGALVGAHSLLQHPHGDINATAGILGTLTAYYQESGTTLERVFLTQTRVLFSYISLILAPFPSKVQLISPQVIARSLVDPPATFLWMTAALGLTAAGGILMRRSPLSGVGILFLVVNFMVEPFLAPQYAFFGYRAVFPMFGVLLISADLVRILLDSLKQPRVRRLASAAICTSAIGLAVFLGLATNNKALIWADRVWFWTDTVEQFPRLSEGMETRSAAQAYSNLGWALCAEGRYAEALGYLQHARNLAPDQAAIAATLAFAWANSGHPKEAERLFEKAIELDPSLAFAHKELGLMLLSRGRHDKAVDHLERALKLAPSDATVRRALNRRNGPAMR
ncbi:MAG: tetratricopeptide repeat protein [Desulfomonilaceae bacterium]|nr:tetratricopeptide repeat protein [Desulfomonilaceae bacterium]